MDTHYFTIKERDRGYRDFINVSELKEGGGFLRNGMLSVTFKIEPVEDSLKYKGKTSRKDTGFIGLHNQGATCYMNSLLQTLYNTPLFRWVC